jgi:hypothetical protein
LNGKHQLLDCVDDVNVLSENTNSIKRNTETVLEADKIQGILAAILFRILFFFRLLSKNVKLKCIKL